MKQLFCSTFLVAALAAPAHADSDGYFCAGNGYVAYQFGLAAPPVAPHRLTIVRFGVSGLQAPQVVELPQFQVHGMSCEANVLRIAAFDAIYTVALDSVPRVVDRVAIPIAERGTFPRDSFIQRNLARLNATTAAMKEDRVLLGKRANGNSFELVMTPTPSTKPCTVNLSSAIVELDASRQRIAGHQVFRGETHRECGGDAPAA